VSGSLLLGVSGTPLVPGAALFAFSAGIAGALGLRELLAVIAPLARSRVPRALAALAAIVDSLVRLGREGRDPGAAERRRLLLSGAVAAFGLGAVVAGPLAGLSVGAAGPWLAARTMRMRRERYRRAVDEGAGAMAVSLADAIGGGHSPRGAVWEAARSVAGPAGHELRRVANELSTGAPTDGALEAMRMRARSHRVDTVVAACLLQRQAGGDLARLLRQCARGFEDQSRLEDEVRSATAQARFTGLIVVLLPVGGALLAELASPGYLVGLWGSFLTAWLVGIALVLQVVAAVLIRRLGGVRW
jgi:tight adherence protein B